jgi:hypothetical protein
MFEVVSPNVEIFSGVSRRTNQICQPLLTVADMLSGDSRERYRTDLLGFARQTESQNREMASESVDAAIVRVLWTQSQNGRGMTCKQVAEGVVEAEKGNIAGLDRWLSANKVGAIVREMGLCTRHTRGGSVVVANASRLRYLMSRFGIAAQPATSTSVDTPPSLLQ